MPPKVKFQQEEIVEAAVEVAREKGAQAVTAREVAAKLGVSTRPIFTYFDTMDELKEAVYEYARVLYRSYLERGLTERIPFLGIWRNYLLFAREEPQLYTLLFLTPPSAGSRGAIEALHFSQDLARESLMRFYGMDEHTADCYFRDLWFVAFGCATLIVTNECPYTDEEMLAMGSEISLSICKAYKEIPGLPTGDYDRDALFSELLAKDAGKTKNAKTAKK